MSHEELSVEQYNSQVKAVWRATVILSVVTIGEVAAALLYMNAFPDGGGPRMLLNIGFIMLSLAKAYFIVGEFMHVRYETRALTLTILVPLTFLIWFIIAFIWEGVEWKNNRNIWGVKIEEHRSAAPAHHGADAHGTDSHNTEHPKEGH